MWAAEKGSGARCGRRSRERFLKAARLLDKRVDRLVWQFRATEPEFYAKHQTARALVDPAARSKEEAAEKKVA